MHRRFEALSSPAASRRPESEIISSVQRQVQLPSARPGTFIRASGPRLSRSCRGAMASAAADDHARRINSRETWPPSRSRRLKITPQVLPLVRRQLFIPSPARGVIVGAGINDCVRDVVVGKVRVIGVAVEGKLQDPCPGHVELVAKRSNVRRDQAKIFRNERQHAQLSLYRAEEISARTRDPLAGLGRSCPGRYMPGGREPAKMIQTDHVHVGEKRTRCDRCTSDSRSGAGRPSCRRGCPRAVP